MSAAIDEGRRVAVALARPAYALYTRRLRRDVLDVRGDGPQVTKGIFHGSAAVAIELIFHGLYHG